MYSRNLLDIFLVVGTQEGWGVWLHLHSVTSVCSHNSYIGLLTHHFFHLSRVTEDAAVLNLYSELFTVPDHSVSVMLWVWFSKKELLNRCLYKYHEKILLLFLLLLILYIILGDLRKVTRNLLESTAGCWRLYVQGDLKTIQWSCLYIKG